MRFEFELPHVFDVSGSTPVANARALRVLLDCLIELNCAYLRDHSPPPLYRAGVRYGRTRVWDAIPALYARTYGDCKSLSAALVAERRKAGQEAEAVFRFRSNPGGGTDYHILVMTPHPSGDPKLAQFEDPSRVLGMGANENARY